MADEAASNKRKREDKPPKKPKAEAGESESKKGGGAKQAWTGEERARLLDEVVKHGAGAADWARVGAECSGRTGVQARDQWRQTLLPKLRQHALLGLPRPGAPETK